MAYYVRAFCTSDALPPLRDAFARDWREAAVAYADDKQPFLVEGTRAGDADALLAEEVEEFIEALSELPASRETTKVTDHLRHSRAVVAAQLLADAGDDGLTAAVTFLVGFAERCDGMIQADGTGFFEGEELIVELD